MNAIEKVRAAHAQLPLDCMMLSYHEFVSMQLIPELLALWEAAHGLKWDSQDGCYYGVSAVENALDALNARAEEVLGGEGGHDIEWARQKVYEYGKDNPWVIANVLGRFPELGGE